MPRLPVRAQSLHPAAPVEFPSRTELGRQAEARAEQEFLRLRPQARLLARNFRGKAGEIDLIFQEGADLVFVEVRMRGVGAWVSALESVDGRKRSRIERQAARFLAQVGAPAGTQGVRFDVLATRDGRHWEHWVGAWNP